MVAMALSSTMLTKPISTAPPKMVPLDTKSALLPLVLFSRSPTLLLSLLHTPMPPRTRYRNATAIIQTKNNATDSTSETFSTLHGSTRRICILARSAPLVREPTCSRLDRAGASPPSRFVDGLARGGRGPGAERSGSSLRSASLRAGASVLVVTGASTRGGTSVRAGAGVSNSAPCPEMKRLMRSSTPGGACGPEDVSGRRGGGFGVRPAAPARSQGATLPLPGSFGELTSAPYVIGSGSASAALTPSSALRATATSVSPSPKFINRTPLVWRPALRTCRAAVRITPPPEVIAYNSVSSSTTSAPTSVPRRRSYW